MNDIKDSMGNDNHNDSQQQVCNDTDMEQLQDKESAAAPNLIKSNSIAGKFNTVEDLTVAYLALEKEFTRRSQELKQLQMQVQVKRAQEVTQDIVKKDKVEVDKESIINEYLRQLQSSYTPPVLKKGLYVPLSSQQPSTLEQAKKIADELLYK